MNTSSLNGNSNFRVSSFSDGGGCVEVWRQDDGGAMVRDTKDPSRQTVLSFNHKEWDAFVRGVKAGEFDPLG